MDPKKANELVLVFDSNLMYGFKDLMEATEFMKVGGISKSDKDSQWFRECVDRALWLPRGKAEDDPNFKQIIPYIVVCSDNKYLTYCRSGAEERLTGKYSIGIGGHLNMKDYLNTLYDVFLNGVRREFWEELDLDENGTHSDNMYLNASLNRIPYMLYDPTDPVGAVHFGAVIFAGAPPIIAEKLRLKEEGFDMQWKSVDELKELGHQLEGWSRLVVEKCL